MVACVCCGCGVALSERFTSVSFSRKGQLSPEGRRKALESCLSSPCPLPKERRSCGHPLLLRPPCVATARSWPTDLTTQQFGQKERNAPVHSSAGGVRHAGRHTSPQTSALAVGAGSFAVIMTNRVDD